MSWEIKVNCDECGEWIDESDHIYCKSCFDFQTIEHEKQIDELKNYITDLEKELEKK